MEPQITMWCELCNAAPADGILKVIRKGDVKASDMWSCQECVNKLPATQWLQNQLGGPDV